MATANYLAAAISSIDGEQPRSVCMSTGVTQATHVAKIAPVPGVSCPATPQKGQAVCGGNSSSTKQG